MVPGWFISELSAGGAKWNVKNILAPRSCSALPALGRLLPSVDDWWRWSWSLMMLKVFHKVQWHFDTVKDISFVKPSYAGICCAFGCVWTKIQIIQYTKSNSISMLTATFVYQKPCAIKSREPQNGTTNKAPRTQSWREAHKVEGACPFCTLQQIRSSY